MTGGATVGGGAGGVKNGFGASTMTSESAGPGSGCTGVSRGLKVSKS